MSEDVTPDTIMQTGMGFMAARQLFAATDVGLFEALAGGPATLGELAGRTDTPPRPTRIVADAMVSVGLLEKEDGAYRNTPEAATFLGGETPADMGPAIDLLELEYRQMADYSTVVETGDPARKSFSLHDSPEVYSAGIEALSGGPARALAEVYDFGRHHRLLDLGGGTGGFLTAVLEAYPELRGTLFELPRVADIARERLQGRPGADRIDVVAGDFFDDPIPGDHDVILLANILHNFPPERCPELLERVRRAAPDGARLLLVDAWTDPDHTEPTMAALLSGQLYLESGGEVYSTEEGRRWLAETGWRDVEHVPVAGPFTVLVAEAVDR